MSLWRAKQRYEANQDLSETAGDALLAINVLHSQSEKLQEEYSPEEIGAWIRDGAEILEHVYTALETPEEASNYYLALAAHLKKAGKKQIAKQLEDDLESEITALREAAETGEWSDSLRQAEERLRRIEAFASETSQRSIDQMRDQFAPGPR